MRIDAFSAGDPCACPPRRVFEASVQPNRRIRLMRTHPDEGVLYLRSRLDGSTADGCGVAASFRKTRKYRPKRRTYDAVGRGLPTCG
jgi:hypothetical protein